MKRIGLTQRVEAIPRYGERRDCLDQKWANLLWGLGFCPVPIANDVQNVESYLIALSLDGIIFTGGNDLEEADGGTDVAPERDRLEHVTLDFCTTTQLPILGICRGLQLMNVHHGGRLVRVNSHVGEPHSTKLETWFFRDCPEYVLTNSFHGFGIDDSSIGANLKIVARAVDGTVEAVIHKNLPQFGVMWHPERERSLTQHDTLMFRSAFGNS